MIHLKHGSKKIASGREGCGVSAPAAVVVFGVRVFVSALWWGGLGERDHAGHHETGVALGWSK